MENKISSTLKKTSIPYQLDDNWTWYKWQDIIDDYQQGLIRSNSQLSNSDGIEYFKMNFIKEDGTYTFDGLPKTFANDDEIENYKIKEGDFFINVRNSKELVGKSCVVYDVPKDILYNHMLVRIKHKAYITGSFISAYLNTNVGKKLLETCKKGTTTVIALYQRDIFELPIPIPNKNLLKQIDSVYNSINRKIELNNKINAELEEMAKTLYDYWFVQFDFPNAEGKPYKSSGGEMVYDDVLKREIPKGWEVKSLKELNSLLVRGISPKYVERDGVQVVNQRCIRDNKIDFSLCRLHDHRVKPVHKIIEVGDILVNSTGVGTLGRVTLVKRLQNPKVTVDSHVTIVRINASEANETFIGVSMLRRQLEIESLGEGSTGQTELSREQLGKLLFLVPQRQIQDRFANIVKPLLEKSSNNEKQNEELASLRDWLLPMLMNGQVKVTEAFKELEEKLAMVAEPEAGYAK